MQQYNLRGIGSKGTIFAGIATYTYTYDGPGVTANGGLTVQIRGTFANPSFASKTTVL